MTFFNRLVVGLVLLLPGISFQTTAEAAEPVRLRFSMECVLRAVAKRKNVQLRSDIALPGLHFENSTPFAVFKKAVMAQGHDFPQEFSNAYAYVGDNNDIYLIDDPRYYARHGRTIDDSLAHELVHFLQVRYQNYDLQTEEFAELEAVDMQTWFRETYMTEKSGLSPCEDGSQS